MTSVDGLISGLNTTTIISQLMAAERLPERQLTSAKATSQTRVSTLQALNSLAASLATAAKAFAPDSITTPSTWASTTATSSNTSLASASTSTGAVAGTATFTVSSVASAGAAVSSGTVSSLTSAVASGPFVLTKGAAAVGLSDVDAGAALSSGAHHIAVTQSSAGATITGSDPVSGFGSLPPAVTIDSSNNTIAYYLDGASTPTTISLAAGTYTPIALAAAIGRASGGAVTAAVDSSGHVQITSTHEGSEASLQLDGSGTANATLGLTDTTTVSHGTDAIVSLDGQNAVTLTSLRAGDTLSLTGANGDSVTATLAGGLRRGTATATSIDVAAGATLSDLASAITSSGTGVSATAVQVGGSAYRLQLTSTTTGADSGITLSSGALSGGLGDMQELYAGSDTVLHVGTGIGAYDVRSSTTSVTGLLTGVTITAAKADPSTPVTVSVTSDSSGIADAMSSLVDSANSVLKYVASKDGYDSTTKTAGPLLGDSLSRSLTQDIADAVVGTSSSTPAMYGVSVARDGTITFDRTAFLAAYAADPKGVQSALTEMAQNIADSADQASDPVSGSITTQITSEQDVIRDYTAQITAFEDRMTLRQQTLQTQYAALETALGSLKSQSDWLSSQLASLPTYSYSSKN